MSNTTQIIDKLVPFCPGWHRNAGHKNLLSVVQDAVDALYEDIPWVYRGTDNQGYPPYLITVAGTYRYEIIAANLSCGDMTVTIDGTEYLMQAKRVKRVFVDVTRGVIDYNRQWIGRPYLADVSILGTRTTRWLIADVNVESLPGAEGVNPSITFLDDPGATTETYFVDVLVGPPELTSESIPIPIPRNFHNAVIDYVQGYCQERENGQSSNYTIRFMNEHKPRFERHFNTAASSRPKETPVRLC